MQFTTESGLAYTVDLKKRILTPVCPSDLIRDPISFYEVYQVFTGSPGAVFVDILGREILTTGRIVAVKDVPAECVSGEHGNVVFRTQNSAYEIDQEQKLIRRLSGTNRIVGNLGLDGEWQKYDCIVDVEVGKHAIIWYGDHAKNQTITSAIREVVGTFISPPREAVS